MYGYAVPVLPETSSTIPEWQPVARLRFTFGGTACGWNAAHVLQPTLTIHVHPGDDARYAVLAAWLDSAGFNEGAVFL